MRSLLKLGLLTALGIGIPSNVLAQTTAAGPAEPKLEFNRVADNLILDLSYTGGMIANPDPTPFIRVFGNGKVIIHYPAYMKKAGDYTLQLSQEELDKLLKNFATEELLTAPESIEAMAVTAITQAGPSELPGDHGVKTNVKVNLDRVVPADTTRAPLTDVKTVISIQSAAIEAGAGAPIQPLQNFSIGVKELEGLANRTDLVKLPGNN